MDRVNSAELLTTQLFQIFLQIFLALEHLNGAGGNVTQAALGRVGFKTGEEALLW